MQERFPYIGEFELTLDDKNRLLIPARVRNDWNVARDGECFILKISPDRKLLLYTEKHYQSFLGQLTHEISPGPRARDFRRAHFALAERVPFDKQGRILIAEKYLRRTNTGHDVVLLGVEDHLELWNRADWERHCDELLSAMDENDSQFRSEKPSPGDAVSGPVED